MLGKLLLLSVLVSTFVSPVLMARQPSATQGVRNTVLLIVVFNVFYLFAIRFIYPHLN
jgi:hypothetical protein